MEGPASIPARRPPPLWHVIHRRPQSPNGEQDNERGRGVPVRPARPQGRTHRSESGVRRLHFERDLRRPYVRQVLPQRPEV